MEDHLAPAKADQELTKRDNSTDKLTTLALKASQPDLQALEKLLTDFEFRQQLRHTCEIIYRRYPADSSIRDAEDLEQDLYQRLLERMMNFDGRASLQTWLFNLAKNFQIDCYRS